MQRSSELAKEKLTQQEVFVLLKQAAQAHEPLILSPSGLSMSFFCHVGDVNEREVVIQSSIPPALAPRIAKCDLFSLHFRSYRIVLNKLEPKGLGLAFELPVEAELAQERADEREYFEREEGTYLLIAHPYDKSTVIRRSVFDLSNGGLSFRAIQLTSFVQPGRILPKVQIYVRGKHKMNRQGKIIYVTRIIEADGKLFYQVGVKFQ